MLCWLPEQPLLCTLTYFGVSYCTVVFKDPPLSLRQTTLVIDSRLAWLLHPAICRIHKMRCPGNYVCRNILKAGIGKLIREADSCAVQMLSDPLSTAMKWKQVILTGNSCLWIICSIRRGADRGCGETQAEPSILVSLCCSMLSPPSQNTLIYLCVLFEGLSIGFYGVSEDKTWDSLLYCHLSHCLCGSLHSPWE